jgi:hypothetical protein
MMFDHVPDGCILQLVADDDSAPHLRAGEFAIVDTVDTDPQHGEVYLVHWASGRTSIQQVIVRRHRLGDEMSTGYWTRCLNFEPYSGAAPSHRSMMDGPRAADAIKTALIGRVIGFYFAP